MKQTKKKNCFPRKRRFNNDGEAKWESASRQSKWNVESNQEKSSQIESFLILFLFLFATEVVVAGFIYDFIFRRILLFTYIVVNNFPLTQFMSQHWTDRKLAKKTNCRRTYSGFNQYCNVELSIMRSLIHFLLSEWIFSTFVNNVLCQYANVRALKTILHILCIHGYIDGEIEWQSSFLSCVFFTFFHTVLFDSNIVSLCFISTKRREKRAHTHTQTNTLVHSHELFATLSSKLTHELFTFAHCTHSIWCAVHNGHCCFSCLECFVARTTSNRIHAYVYGCPRV